MATNPHAWLEAYPAVNQQQPEQQTAATAGQPQDNSWLEQYPAVQDQGQQAQPNQPARQSGFFEDTRENQGTGTAAIRGVGDGLTFGFQDEILAGLDAAIQPLIPIPANGSDAPTFSERYQQNLSGERDRLRAGQDQNPVASIAGGIAGGVVPALLTGGASLGPSVAGAAGRQTVGRAIATGAGTGSAYGGAYGFGSADGDLSDRAGGALGGAVLGGVVGGALPGVIGAVKGVKNAVANPEVRAQNQLNRALERDNLTPQQFRDQYNDLAARHPDTAIPADAGGENVSGLVERLANTPGQARSTVIDTLMRRTASQGERVSNSLKNLTGVARSAYQATDEVMTERARAAAPLYEQAYKEPIPWGADLQSLMSRPAMQAAYRDAETRAANQGRVFDGTFVEFAPDGTAIPRRVPSTGDLDVIKQNLDDQIEGLMGSNQRAKARDVITIKNELLNIMDASAPTYAKARASFAGHSEYLKAIDNGKTLLHEGMPAEQWAAMLSKMNASEKEAVRIGAVSSIISKIANNSAKAPDVTRYFRSAEGKKKLDLILPDDAARKAWADRVAQESNVSRLTNRATGNSSTARRSAEADDADELIVDMASSMLSGGATSILHTLLRTLPRSAGDRFNERSNRIMAKALTSKEGLDALNGVNPRAMVGRALPAIAGVAAGQGGAASTNRRNEAIRRREQRRGFAQQGFYPTQGAANSVLRDEGMKDGYEAVKQPGTGSWAIRPKNR